MRSSPLTDRTANPLLQPWDGPLGAPSFAQVRDEDFLPALAVAIDCHKAEIEAITRQEAPATFDNTIVELERSGQTLARVRRWFWMLSSAQGTPGIRAIEAEMSARLSSHSVEISHDAALAARVFAVHSARHESGLAPDQIRLVESSHAGFLRGGAALAPAEKARFAAIDARLSILAVQFGQNVLAATAAWVLDLGADDLADYLQPCARRLRLERQRRA